MSTRFKAVAEQGLLRPTETIDLQEGQVVFCDSNEVSEDRHGANSDPRAITGLDRLLHELSTPLVATRAAIQMAERELQDDKLLSQPYLQDASSWLTLMINLLKTFQSKTKDLTLSRFSLLRDVIVPAVRHIDILLQERNFSSSNIVLSKLETLPPLYADREQLSQVFFNLLSNAVKYAYKDPSAFYVEIAAEISSDSFLIHFRDWGCGVPNGFEDKIFQPGFRAPSSHAFGHGLGLTVAREIAVAHGGSLLLSNTQDPTDFLLVLPKALAVSRMSPAKGSL